MKPVYFCLWLLLRGKWSRLMVWNLMIFAISSELVNLRVSKLEVWRSCVAFVFKPSQLVLYTLYVFFMYYTIYNTIHFHSHRWMMNEVFSWKCHQESSWTDTVCWRKAEELFVSPEGSLPPNVTQYHALDLSRVQHRRGESAEPKKETHVSFSDTSPRWDRKESHSRRSPKSRLSLSTNLSRGVPCLSTRSWCFVTKWESSPAGLRGGTNASRRWRYCRSSSASVVPKRASCSSVWSIPWLTAPSCMFWKEKPITQVSTEGSPSHPHHEQNESRWYRAVAVKNRCTFFGSCRVIRLFKRCLYLNFV